jgi:hypothetical protein
MGATIWCGPGSLRTVLRRPASRLYEKTPAHQLAPSLRDLQTGCGHAWQRRSRFVLPFPSHIVVVLCRDVHVWRPNTVRNDPGLAPSDISIGPRTAPLRMCLLTAFPPVPLPPSEGSAWVVAE